MIQRVWHSTDYYAPLLMMLIIIIIIFKIIIIIVVCRNVPYFRRSFCTDNVSKNLRSLSSFSVSSSSRFRLAVTFASVSRDGTSNWTCSRETFFAVLEERILVWHDVSVPRCKYVFSMMYCKLHTHAQLYKYILHQANQRCLRDVLIDEVNLDGMCAFALSARVSSTDSNPSFDVIVRDLEFSRNSIFLPVEHDLGCGLKGCS